MEILPFVILAKARIQTCLHPHLLDSSLRWNDTFTFANSIFGVMTKKKGNVKIMAGMITYSDYLSINQKQANPAFLLDTRPARVLQFQLLGCRTPKSMIRRTIWLEM
jgi:hypothetical protein